MEQVSSIAEIKNTNNLLKKDRIIVPIDMNWRQNYYRKVFRKRIAAFILDYFTTLMIATVPAVILFSWEDHPSTMALVFQMLCFVLLCALMESSKWQSTFGKRIMKIQITDDMGNSISFSRALKRNLLRIVIGYSYCFIIPLIIQYFRFKKTKKLFHDEISHTVIGERLM